MAGVYKFHFNILPIFFYLASLHHHPDTPIFLSRAIRYHFSFTIVYDDDLDKNLLEYGGNINGSAT